MQTPYCGKKKKSIIFSHLIALPPIFLLYVPIHILFSLFGMGCDYPPLPAQLGNYDQIIL